MATNQYVVQYVNKVLGRASDDMLEHFVVALEPEELYAMICGYDQTMLDVFSRASGYQPKDNYSGQIKVPVLLKGRVQTTELVFNVGIESCARYHSYYIPQKVAAITPESNIYSKLEPAILLAQEWKMTRDLFGRFSQVMSTDAIASILPWLKDMGKDAMVEIAECDGDHSRFTTRYSMGYMRDKQFVRVITALKRLGNPGRSSSPALTRRVNDATRIGDRLMAQWRMLKNQKDTVDHRTFVSIAQHDALLPNWYVGDMGDILANWERERLGLDEGEW